jgi:DNA-directed RNA polymerase specialized sigma24 family protein
VWRRWKRVETADSPAGYLYTTAFNAFRNRLRTTSRAARALIKPTADSDPSEAVDDRSTVLGALRGLPARTRAAVVLTELLGYSSDEAGQILRVRASSARSLATHGRADLRRRFGGNL